MPLILNIETTSTICSVCLAKDGQPIDFRQDERGNSHARVLTVFIEDLMQKNGITVANLDAIAVSAGPGSYTGLRIGTSGAKGLCYALNKHLIAVPTLLSMAGEVMTKTNDRQACYMPAIDARRMDIYTAVFNAAGEEIISTRAITVDDAYKNQLKQFDKLFVFGSGAEKCKPVLTSGNFHFVPNIQCDARFLSPFSEARFLNHQFEDVAYFEPYYLKEFGSKT